MHKTNWKPFFSVKSVHDQFLLCMCTKGVIKRHWSRLSLVLLRPAAVETILCAVDK